MFLKQSLRMMKVNQERFKIFNTAARNLRIRGLSRNLMVVLMVLLAVGTLFTALLFYRSVQKDIQEKVESLGGELIVMPKANVDITKEIMAGQIDSMSEGALTDDFLHLNMLSELVKIEGVQQVSPMLFLSVWGEEGGGPCCGKFANVYLLGFDPKSDFTVKRLSKNKSVSQRPIADDELIIGYYHSFPMEGFGVTRIGVYGYAQKVTGMLEKTGTGLDWSFFLPLNGIYAMTKAGFSELVPEATAERLSKITEGKVSIFLIKVRPATMNAETVAMNITKAVPGLAVAPTVEMVITPTQRQLHHRSKKSFHFGLIFWLLISLIVGVFSCLGVNKRNKEIPLYETAGASRGALFKLVLYESVLLTTPGCLLGLILGAITVFRLRNFFFLIMGMPPTWPTPFFLGVLIILFLAAAWIPGVLAGLYVAIRSPVVAKDQMAPTYEAV